MTSRSDGRPEHRMRCSGTYLAGCICGWVAPKPSPTRALAEREFDDHLLAAMSDLR